LGLGRLYITSANRVFAGIEGSPKSAYRVIGVPYDSTTSFRPGTRFGPDAVRLAAAGLESNSAFIKDVFLEDLSPYDEGDVAVSIGDTNETISRVETVIRELSSSGLPVMIGGEHTVTLGALRAFAERNPCVVMFDAHLDLRNEYLGLKVGHATFMRRALEQVRVPKLIYVGARALSREELEFVRTRSNIAVFSPTDIMTLGPVNVASSISSHLKDCEGFYLTVDMDAFDPAYAPGVGNPEPLGLTPYDGLYMVSRIVDERLLGVDVVEVSPHYDPGGGTAALAAKVLIEAMIKHYVSSKDSKQRRPS
jgi:agmatinase